MAPAILIFVYLLAAAAVAVILYAVFIIIRQYTYWKRRGIPHLDLVPIVGNNFPIFLRNVSIPIHSQNLYKKFPGTKYFGMFDLKRPMVFIKDPELIREVGVRKYENFIDHDIFVTEEMDPMAGRNLFSLRGQRWKDMRSTLSPSFTSAKIKLMFQLIAECAKDFVQYLVKHPELTKDLEIRDALSRYTSDVIATTAFGIKVDSMRDRDNEFFLHGKAATAFSPMWIVKFELMRHFPKFMHWIGATLLPKSTDRFFKKLITETVKTRQKNGIVRQDIIHMMMQAMNKEDSPTKVTMEDIMGQSFVFFIAGFDTSSAIMSFLAHELAANLDVQERLHREIDQQFPNDSVDITYDALSEMKYLDMVVEETLRLYPPAAILNRVCIKDWNFPPPAEGYPTYHMTSGTIILMSLYGLHRDPKYFPDPDKFDPERFNDVNKNKIKPYTYLPFGVGPRQCIASRFATLEVKLVIINLLRKFVITFTDKTRHPIVFDKRTFNMSAEGGVWVSLKERTKIN